MKAWLLDRLDGIEHLQIAEVADPEPGSGEALVRIDLAALNPADRYLAMNQYPAKPPMPHILGRDGIGVVEQVGRDATSVKTGDRVIVLRSEVGVTRAGTFAEKVVVPVASLAAVPDGWTDEQAGGAALVYLTAYQAMTQWGDLQPGVVLITGASGGVGSASVQLAAAAGHTVVALSRSGSKREQLKSIGAAHCFDPSAANWTDQLKQALGSRKVDLAIDNIGGSLFSQVVSVLGHQGKMSVVGRLAGSVPEFNTSSILFRRIKIGGVAVGDYTPSESQLAWKRVVEMMNRAGVRPRVDSVFDFDALPDAFAKLEAGPLGKVLIKVNNHFFSKS